MKKIFLLSVIFLGLLSLTACDNSNTEYTDNPTNNPTNYNTEETGDFITEPVESDNLNTENNNSLQGGQQNERLPLEIVETGYGFASWNEDSLSYGIVLYNPNNEALEFPSIRLTVRRADNTIIGTDDLTFNIIYPSQTLTLGDISSFRVIQDEVYSVEFEVLEPNDWSWTGGEFIELEAINLSLTNTGRDGYNVTGEISNANEREFNRLRLDMILRNSDGQIVGGDFTFIDGPSANGSVPFQIGIRDSILQNVEGEWEVEIHASPW